jgi:hypothetical protein
MGRSRQMRRKPHEVVILYSLRLTAVTPLWIPGFIKQLNSLIKRTGFGL